MKIKKVSIMRFCRVSERNVQAKKKTFQTMRYALRRPVNIPARLELSQQKSQVHDTFLRETCANTMQKHGQILLQNCKIVKSPDNTKLDYLFFYPGYGTKKVTHKKRFFPSSFLKFFEIFLNGRTGTTGPKNVFNRHTSNSTSITHSAAPIGRKCRETLQYHLPNCVCNRTSHC